MRIKRDIALDLIFTMLIMFLAIYYGADADCGIPIFTWTIVYFIVLGLRSVSNFIRIYLVRNYYRYANRFSVLSFVLIDGFILGWLIYGNVIFYSHDNDCNDLDGSKTIYNMMLVLLIIGYF